MTVAIDYQLLNNIQEFDVGDMIKELDNAEDAYLAALEPSKLIPNFNKIEKKELKVFKLLNSGHATAVINTYTAISDDKLSREQIRRANRKPRKITHKTVEAREFMGIYN